MQGYRTTVTLCMYQNTVNIIINGFRLSHTACAVPLVPCIKYLAATSIIKFFLLWDIIVSSFCYIATNQHQDCHVNLLLNRDQNHSSCIKNTNHSLSNLKKVVFNKKDLGSILESIIFRYKYCWLWKTYFTLWLFLADPTAGLVCLIPISKFWKLTFSKLKTLSLKNG